MDMGPRERDLKEENKNEDHKTVRGTARSDSVTTSTTSESSTLSAGG